MSHYLVIRSIRGGRYCMTRPFMGPFGEVWDWVSKAKFVGTVKVDGNRFDVWNYTVSCSILLDLLSSIYISGRHIYTVFMDEQVTYT